MIPVVDNDHKAEALALLTDMFKKQPVITGILSSLASEIQQLEDAVWEVFTGLLLANAVGDVLDKYGSIVLVPRTGKTDADYKIAILLKIRIIRSSGLAEDIIQAAALVLATFLYEEWQPAGWTVSSLNVASPVPVLEQLGKAKAAGTRGNFLYSTWPTATNIVWGSTVGSVPAAAGFMDLISSSPPNVMISSQELR